MDTVLSNKLYDIAKYIAVIAIPAFGAFVLTIGHIWNIPYTDAIVATIDALAVLMGALLQITSKKYNEIQTIQNIQSEMITEEIANNFETTAPESPGEEV